MNTVICPSCGARFDAGCEACPHCGNTHLEGAKKVFQSRLLLLRARIFAKTKEAHLYRMIAAKGILLFVMLVFLVYLIVFQAGLGTRLIRQKFADADANVATHEAVLTDYLAAGEYNLAARYLRRHAIYIISEDDPYVRFAAVSELLEMYDMLFAKIAALQEGKPVSDNTASYCARVLVDFYDACTPDYLTHHPFAKQLDMALTKESAASMKRELEVLLAYGFHLTQEDIASLPALSETDIRDLLTERNKREE